MSDYEDDVLSWSERQGALLRRVAAGEPVNEQPDWPNVIEEIESVGRNDLHAVEGLLTQALGHMLKLLAWPDAPAVSGWTKEARTFRRQARRRFAPSMAQKINLEELYADALDLMPESMDGRAPGPVPEQCPVTLNEILADEPRGSAT
jgi:hypothetical protein